MKNFYIIANEDKQNTSWTVKRMVEYLSLKGASCKVHESREEEEGRGTLEMVHRREQEVLEL